MRLIPDDLVKLFAISQDEMAAAKRDGSADILAAILETRLHSPEPKEAKAGPRKRVKLSEIQARKRNRAG